MRKENNDKYQTERGEKPILKDSTLVRLLFFKFD